MFQADAKPTTRPMTYYVESPEAIAHLFDNIAYAKCNNHWRNQNNLQIKTEKLFLLISWLRIADVLARFHRREFQKRTFLLFDCEVNGRPYFGIFILVQFIHNFFF